MRLKFFFSRPSSVAEYISETMKLGASLPSYRTFALEELMEATNNFEASSLLGGSSNSQVRILCC